MLPLKIHRHKAHHKTCAPRRKAAFKTWTALWPQPQGRQKDTGCSDHLNYYYCQEESLLDHIFTRQGDQIWEQTLLDSKVLQWRKHQARVLACFRLQFNCVFKTHLDQDTTDSPWASSTKEVCNRHLVRNQAESLGGACGSRAVYCWLISSPDHCLIPGFISASLPDSRGCLIDISNLSNTKLPFLFQISSSSFQQSHMASLLVAQNKNVPRNW